MNWIEVNGQALRYRVRGESGPWLVLIHEMGGTLESWDKVAPELALKRRVLCYDTRGAGLSEKITGEVTVDELADDLAALLTALEINEPIAVAGCAVGAAVALRFSVVYAERVAALIIINPAIDATPEAQQNLFARADLMRQRGMRSVEIASLDTGYPTKYRERDRKHFDAFRARWLGNDPVSIGALFRMLARTDLFPEMNRVTAPVLALAGVDDPLRPPSYVQRVVENIRDCEMVEIDAAHHVPDQAPEIVCHYISRFLGRLQPVEKCGPA